MINLIPTVVALSLTALMALVATYYGGGMLSQYQAEAHASRLIGEGEQIAGTVSYYTTEQQSLPASMEELVEKHYFMEVPGKGANAQWKFSKGYAVNSIGSGSMVNRSCLAARRRFGLDAGKYCRNQESAGCSASTSYAPADCNKHCVRTCFDPADRHIWNPRLDPGDPCCIDNSRDAAIADPVFIEGSQP